MPTPPLAAPHASRPPGTLNDAQAQHGGAGPQAPGSSEQRTKAVAIVTALAMVLEIVAGWWFNSMALLADGWHMGSHAAAIGLSALAYALSRRYRHDPRFAFGTWKIEVLAGFTSALALLGVAVGMGWASLVRIFDPQPIQYLEAIGVTLLGLAVNVACVFVLGPGRAHGHGHSHGHGHGHAHGHAHAHAPAQPGDDINLRSAYLHVLADAATSVLAVVALLGGLLWQWAWLDPAMGLLGAVLVLRWSWGLLGETVRALLDCDSGHPLVAEIGKAIREQAPWSQHVEVVELRVWRTGSAQFAAIVKLHSHAPWVGAAAVRQFLSRYPALAHLNVEVVQRGSR